VSCLACRVPWHEGLSCTEYQRQAVWTMQSEGDTTDAAGGRDDGGLGGMGDVRGCPHCGVPTTRNQGCNNIKCTSCGTNWFWSDDKVPQKAALYKERPSGWSEQARSMGLLGGSFALLWYNVGKMLQPGAWCLHLHLYHTTLSACGIQLIAESTVRGMGLADWPWLTSHGFVIPILGALSLSAMWGAHQVLGLCMWLAPQWLGGWLEGVFSWGAASIDNGLGAGFLCFALSETGQVMQVKMGRWLKALE